MHSLTPRSVLSPNFPQDDADACGRCCLRLHRCGIVPTQCLSSTESAASQGATARAKELLEARLVKSGTPSQLSGAFKCTAASSHAVVE